jgi:MFS family permease
VLALPYGLLADRIGRKPTILLAIPGFVLNIVVQGIVLWFSETIPLRAIWLSSLTWLFGGGLVVAAAVIWTMMTDVTTEAQR